MSHKVRGGGRRCARWLTSLALGWTGFAAWQQSAQAGPMVNRGVAATAVIHQTVNLAIGCHTFETKNPTPSGSAVDSVMHIWGTPAGVEGMPSSTKLQELDRNDDFTSASGMSRVQYFCITVPKTIDIIVYASSPATAGRVDLYVNGTANVVQGKIGSTLIHQPLTYPGPLPGDLEIETAFEPGGTSDSMLYAFSWDGRLTGFDDNSGVGKQSKLRASELYFAPPGPPFTWDLAADWVRVASKLETDEGVISVIFNDYLNDADGDHLGKYLEAELGTCDARSDGNCPTWFTVLDEVPRDVPSTVGYHEYDTDRDGIRDDYEVFGREGEGAFANQPQYLPKWGANPLHKDVFLEMDWRFAPGVVPSATHPIDFSFLLQVEDYYRVGPMSHLLNPDGLDGIKLHVDIGKPPLSAGDTLFGNWGGSSQVDWVAGETSAAATQYTIQIPTASPRFGVFRYALADIVGPDIVKLGGQANGAYFGFQTNATYLPVVIKNFAHELGHTLNLAHYGDPNGGWGFFNCNPLYPSIMSYSDRPGIGFSLGNNADVVMDPSAISETFLPVPFEFDWPGTAGVHPYSYDVTTSYFSFSVDFNRDGEPLNPPTGAQRTLFPWTSTVGYRACAIHSQKARWLTNTTVVSGETVISERPVLADSAPRMVQSPGNLYVFRLAPAGITYTRTARSTVNENGSCAKVTGGSALNAKDYDESCDTFGGDLGIVPLPPSGTGGSGAIKGFSAIYGWINGKIAVAYRDSSDQLRFVEGVVQTSGVIAWDAVQLLDTDIRSEPELSELSGNVSSEWLQFQALVYVKSDGQYAWRKRKNGAPWAATAAVLDEAGAGITGTGTASLPATLSQVGLTVVGTFGPGPIRTCAIFPTGPDAEAAFYCYVPATDRWRLHPSAFMTGTGPSAITLKLKRKAALALHYPRTSTGADWALSSTNSRAEFWAILPLRTDDLPPRVSRSAPFSFGVTSIPDDLRFTTGVPITDEPTVGGAVSLFEVKESTGLRAAYVTRFNPHEPLPLVPVVLPMVDGGFKATVSDGSDFRVMERGICSRVNLACEADAVPNKWGY